MHENREKRRRGDELHLKVPSEHPAATAAVRAIVARMVEKNFIFEGGLCVYEDFFELFDGLVGGCQVGKGPGRCFW